MALIGTISGSVSSGALTSTNVISGTLVIANVKTNFPVITSDSVLFVSGAVGGTSKSVFGGDLVVSGNINGKSGFSLSGATSTGSFSGDLDVATVQDYSKQTSFRKLAQVKFSALIQGFQPENNVCIGC